jgi:hypothetical protein
MINSLSKNYILAVHIEKSFLNRKSELTLHPASNDSILQTEYSYYESILLRTYVERTGEVLVFFIFTVQPNRMVQAWKKYHR